MKKRSIKFEFTLDIAYPDYLDDEFVYESFLSSPRFSVDMFHGELGIVNGASTGIKEVRIC